MFVTHGSVTHPALLGHATHYYVGLKRMVNLLSEYPYANICAYPTDSDIIKLALLAIYFIFISTSLPKYSSLSILIST